MKYGLVIVAIAGCSFPTPSEQYACVTTADCQGTRVCDQGFCVVPGGNAVDSGSDVVVPDTGGPRFACAGWSPRHFDPCTIPQPTGPLALTAAGTYTYDTTAGTLKDTAGNAMPSPPSMIVTAGGGRILSVDSLDVGPTSILRVVGMEPLIVAAWTTVSVAGTIDASSTALGNGAGANPAACAARAALIGQSNIDGAGGGGGAFAAPGGRGGNCNNGGAGGTGGILVAVPLLLGGCPGANGGAGEQLGGVGGAGGGAVQLTARMGITLAASARINVGGSGGAGATSNGNESDGGGGGGGAGGMIGMQGATITLTAGAIVAANGGGGGQGSNNAPGGRGSNGLVGATRAAGGAGGDAGNGGVGGALLVPAGGIGNNDGADGAGGGGGGTGYIVLTSTAAASTAGATLSPTPTISAP